MSKNNITLAAFKKSTLTVLAVFALVMSPFAADPVGAFNSAFDPNAAIGGAEFNGDPKDKPTMRVTNYTRNQDCNTCWSYETSAERGNIVSFDVYYHNTGESSAPNTNVSVSVTPSGSYLSARGTVQSGSAVATGNANVNVTNMDGYKDLNARFLSAIWYPNQSTSGQQLSASSPSVNIGTIQPGWEYQGHVVFRFEIGATKVDTTTPPGDTPPPSGNTRDAWGFHENAAGKQPVSNCIASGWAADPDTPSTPVDVIIRVNGGNGGANTKTYVTKANLNRSDLATAGVCTGGNCAFVQKLDLAPGVSHNIEVSAKDSQSGKESLLHWTDKDITCGEEASTTPPPQTCPAGSSPVATTGGAIEVNTFSARVSGFIDGKGKQVEWWAEIGTTPDQLNPSSSPRISSGNVTSAFSPLQASTTYYYRFVVKTECGKVAGEVRSFRTLPDDTPPPSNPTCQARPSVALSVASKNQTSISVSGSVDPNGSATSYRFRLRRDGAVVQESGSFSAGSGTSNVAVSNTFSNLSPNTTYTIELVAQNCADTSATTVTATTDTTVTPTCQARPSVALSVASKNQTSISVSGSVDPNGSATSYRFRLRRDGAVVQESGSFSAGSGTSNVAVSNTFSNLSPNTTYTIELVAQNCADTSATTVTATTDNTPVNPTCTTRPSITLNAASGITQTGFTISGNISPNGDATTYRIRVRRDNAIVDEVPFTSAGSSGSFPFSRQFSGLTANTDYDVEVTAQSCAGTEARQTVVRTTPTTQCTPPSVSTGSYTALSETSVRITGTATGNTSSMRLEYRRQGDSAWILAGTGSSAEIYNLSRNTTYEYRATAQNDCNTAIGSVLTFFLSGGGGGGGNPPDAETRLPSSVTSSAANLRGEVNPRGAETTAWFEWGVNRYDVENGSGQRVGYTSVGSGNNYRDVSYYLSSLTSGTTYYYRVAASNAYGTDRGQVVEFRTDGSIQNNAQPPTVITSPATNVGRTVALLNGRVNPNLGVTTAWFEWGTNFSSVAAGNGIQTGFQPMGSGSSMIDFSHPLSGLTPGVTYYFRAAARNQSGTNYGQVLSFVTISGGGGGGGTVITQQPPIIVTTLVGGVGGSCLTLTPSINGEVLPGGEFVYGITYRNDCPFDLQNTTLRNIIPNEVDFASTNYPFLTRDLNVITYSLGTVPRNFQATVLVRGIVKPTVRIGDTLMFKSDLAFTDPRGQFQTISSTLPVAVGAGSMAATGQVLGASIFDTLGGLFTSGWFWFLLFLLLLALFILWLATRGRGEDHDHE